MTNKKTTTVSSNKLQYLAFLVRFCRFSSCFVGTAAGPVWIVPFFGLTRAPLFKRLNLPLCVSKPTVIRPEILWEVRWLPRLSHNLCNAKIERVRAAHLKPRAESLKPPQEHADKVWQTRFPQLRWGFLETLPV